MDKLRIRFEKTGRAVYISHLDLMRTMQRAFLRAGLPLKYSEGFNPHAQISFALPLSVGTSSICELMDFALIEDYDLNAIPDMLNKALPEGIRVLDVYEWDKKFKFIKWLAIKGKFEYDLADTNELLPKLTDFYKQENIVIRKKTKSGMSDVDIAPGLKSLEFEASDKFVSVNAILSAQEPTINPELLVMSLNQLAPEIAPDFATFQRIQLYDCDMNIFE